MKKILLFVFSAALCLASCRADDIAPDPDSSSQEQSSSSQEEPAVPEKTPDEDVIATLYLSTPGMCPVESKDIWTEDADFALVTDGENVLSSGKTSIKRRGNSSYWHPKRSYNLKFEIKTKILGMPASKRWCLLACWMDRTMLRNDVAFEISRRTSLAWTPRGRFVKLCFNGSDQGLYYLVEKIKIARERVPISDDGYIVELDSYFDEVNKFRSQYLSLPVNFKEPDEDVMTTEKFNAFVSYFNETERLVTSLDPAYRERIDVDSFIDWMLVQELVENGESWHPKSTYMYKDTDGPLHFGPTWDHDWQTFCPSVTYFTCAGNIWFAYLFKDKWFADRVRERWRDLRSGFETIPDYIDHRASVIRLDAIANCSRWPINQNVNGDEALSFDDAVARMKKAYEERFRFLDMKFSLP